MVTNFGNPSSDELPQRLYVTKPDSRRYVFDCELIDRLEKETTRYSEAYFPGNYERFVKEQFLLSLLHDYTLELHKIYLKEGYFLPFSYTIAAICVFLLDITQGLVPYLGDSSPDDSSEHGVWFWRDKLESEIIMPYRLVPIIGLH